MVARFKDSSALRQDTKAIADNIAEEIKTVSEMITTLPDSESYLLFRVNAYLTQVESLVLTSSKILYDEQLD